MKERKNIRQQLWNKPQKFIEWLFSKKEWSSFDQKERLDEKTSEQLLQNIKAQLKRDSSDDKKEKSLGIYWPGIFAAAATLVILLVAIGLWKIAEKDTSPLELKPAPTLAQGTPLWKVYHNTSIENIKLSLPDSSLVTLYPKSTLRHLENFTDSTREIYLTGKAFFDVVKEKERPFSAYAGGLKTTALGTSFTINTAVSGNNTIVKLHTGKVQVQTEHLRDNAVNKILLPGDAFTFNRTTKREVIKLEKPVPVRKELESSFEMVNNVLQFKNIKLNEVLKILSDTYQVSIEIGTAVEAEDITYTGDIGVKLERIDDVLQKICLLNDFELQGSSDEGFIIQAK